MAKKVVVITCHFVHDEILKGTVNRTYLIPRRYKETDREEFSRKLKESVSSVNCTLIAYKFGKVEEKTPLVFNEFKQIHVSDIEDISDWYLLLSLEDVEIKTLDRRIDPIILFMGDKKRLKFRINYYLDLLKRGYSEEEAMKTIF